MSLSSFLSIARSAMLAHQRAMDVTAHNVANAQTPGYSRQRIDLQANTPLWSPIGTIGRGVTDGGITRVRDQFFDAAFRRDSGLLGQSTTLGNLLGQVEAGMNEPSDSGIAAAMDGMFSSFGDLANDPSNGTSRNLVRQAASRFVTQLHALDTRITQVADGAHLQMVEQVKQVNEIANQLADLNARILSSGGPMHTAPDLEDRRDALVDQLSGFMGVRVTQHADGSIGVTAGDSLLVDGASAQQLEVRAVGGGGYGVAIVGAAGTMSPQGGTLGALVDLTTTKLPAIRAQLNQLAQALVTAVNAIHQTGITPAGATGTNFFDPTGVTAGTIALDPAIAASGDAIAAGTGGTAGSGDVALKIAALATGPLAALGNQSAREFYTQLASSVGSDVQAASRDADSAQALVDSSDAQRQSISGVSIDEEMVALITEQQAFSAAARLVNIANQMMEDVLRMV